MQNKKNKNKTPKKIENVKPKNMKSSLNRLIKSLTKFKVLIISALVLASLSSILSLSSPNLLKNLTNKISEGVGVNTDNLEQLSESIKSDLAKDNFAIKVASILDIKLNEDIIYKVNTSNITDADKNSFNNYLKSLSKFKDENANGNVFSLSESVFNIILEDTTYNDILITKKDKIDFINVMKDINLESNNFSFVKDIPTSINKVLFPSSNIDNVEIPSSDKVSFMILSSEITDKEDMEKLSSTLDKMPSSIQKLLSPSLDMKYIKTLAIILVIIYLVSAVFSYSEGRLMINVANKYAKGLRTSISKKINTLPLKYFDSNSSGDILSRITNDVDTIAQSLNNSLSSLVAALTMFVGSIIMMFITNPIMAITAIISSLLGFVIMAFILSKSQKYFTARQAELGKINGYISEVYTGLNVVKTCNAKDTSLEEFDKLNNKLYECDRKSQFLSGLMQPIMMFVGNLGYVSVCVVGAILVSKDIISFGTIVAFIMYVRLFISPLSEIAEAFASLQTTVAASDRVFEFIDAVDMPEEKITKKISKKEAKGKIEFNKVKFGYNEDKIIIHDFTAVAKPGQKIAIVGPTGAGKTTMVNLLMKFYDINDGDIKIDDISIKDLSRDNIHSLFTMVLQDTWLFHGTIKDNLKYNRKHVSDKKIEEVCSLVGIDHFIKTLPKGYDTEITENDTISAGQKQLLTIARAMIEDTPFLILDEATSNVDTRTEELVQKAMDHLIKNKTSFIIAHRLSTIKNADLILVMKDGDIIEKGNHNELMKQNGFYTSLYNSQFEKVK